MKINQPANQDIRSSLKGLRICDMNNREGDESGSFVDGEKNEEENNQRNSLPLLCT